MATKDKEVVTLALDLSTSSSGYAVFHSDNLKKSGYIKPKVKGITRMKYPESGLMKIMDLSEKIRDLVQEVNPDQIVIEEVNRGINRVGQKTLDALHFMVLLFMRIEDKNIFKKVSYIDSNGKTGWRVLLGLSTKKKYPHLKGASKKWKKVAEDFVNGHFGTNFDVIKTPFQADEVDAIALGYAYITYLMSKTAYAK